MDIFSTISGRAELIVASKTKNYEEVDFEVRFPLELLKLAEKGETRISEASKTAQKNICVDC